MRNRADLESIHKFSSRNRQLLEESDLAGCFYCQARFAPSDILDWIPENLDDSSEGLDSGVTALCPKCGIDSVLPSAAPIQFDDTLLSDMKAYWFDRTVKV